MSRTSLYSVHNVLTPRALTPSQPPDVHLELNPAVVVANGQRKFALSAVWIGPSLETERSTVSLSFEFGEYTIEIDSILARSEPTDSGKWLSVALFSVSRQLLKLLSEADDLQVHLAAGSRRLVCQLDEQNRGNVVAFLGQVEGQAPSGNERVTKGEDDSDRPVVESVAV